MKKERREVDKSGEGERSSSLGRGKEGRERWREEGGRESGREVGWDEGTEEGRE